jgi:hypothetical protein
MTPKQVERIRAKFVTLRKSSCGVTGYPPEFVEAIYNDYMAHGEVIVRIAARWKRNPSSIGALLVKWGLIERSPERQDAIKNRQRDAGARFAAGNHATPAEIEKIIDRMVATPRHGKGACTIFIPPELRWEFKSWPMEKRGDFIARLRAKLNSAKDRPTTPFSKNVAPFDYTTPAARAIKDRLNAGLNSWESVCKINICSQGVIYKGELYFWTAKPGYEKRGSWKRGAGRPLLHRIIWEETNGPLPPKHCVYFEDGNRNNFDPENLRLMSMNENARRNQAAHLFRQSREVTALLFKRSQGKDEDGHITTIQTLRAA